MPRQHQGYPPQGEHRVFVRPLQHGVHIFAGQGRVGQGDLDVPLLHGGNGLADAGDAFQVIFRRALLRRLVGGQDGVLRGQLLRLAAVGAFGAVQIKAVQILRHKPDGALVPGKADGLVQENHPGVQHLLGPGGIDRQAVVGGGLNHRRVAVPGNEDFRLVLRQEGEQLQKRLHIALRAHHVAGKHHAGVVQRAQGLLDGRLILADFPAVQIADVQDRPVFQVTGQVLHGDALACQRHLMVQREIADDRGHHGQAKRHPQPCKHLPATAALRLAGKDILVLPPPAPHRIRLHFDLIIYYMPARPGLQGHPEGICIACVRARPGMLCPYGIGRCAYGP